MIFLLFIFGKDNIIQRQKNVLSINISIGLNICCDMYKTCCSNMKQKNKLSILKKKILVVTQ